MNWRDKRVVILGLARQGTALARYLAGQGARVTVSDADETVVSSPAGQLTEALESLRHLTIEYVLGGHPLTLLDGADVLCLSSGVPVDLPIVREAGRRGILIANDSQIFLEAAPCKVIGITGSAGKTTTTALTGMMIQTDRGHVWVGGNIGRPLLNDLAEMKPDDLAVMELSSFQLEIMTVSPPIAGVLNITPNHLDRHGTMDVYIAAKSQIVHHQNAGDIAVLGWGDENARSLGAAAPGQVWWFGVEPPTAESAGTFLRDGVIYLRDGERERSVCPVSEIRLRGAHNVLNVLAACALSGAASIPPEAMREAINKFPGVAHRLELVRERDGVQWYNDSIATAPERVIAALNSFTAPIVLLAGGRDKKLPWGELMALARQRVKTLIVFGEAADLIAGAAEAENQKVEGRVYKMTPKLLKVEKVETMAEAIDKAAEIAEAGDVVLLSPGCTSFDAFKDFAERGEKFSERVKLL
jgi:UDP-N-acetylmuramoylalanine--D-glutamate ligase